MTSTQFQLSPQQRSTIEGVGGVAATLSGVVPRFDDGLSPLRGIVASAVLSLPVWAGLGLVTWRVLR